MALNPFSERFVARLLAAHPEWAALVEPDPAGFPPPGSARVVVPSPVPGRQLLIRTYGDQVTVDFGGDGWHQHFLAAAHRDEAAAQSAALRFVNDLLADRLLVATRHLGPWRLWSRPVDAARLSDPWVGSTTVISWSGARDATLPRQQA